MHRITTTRLEQCFGSSSPVALVTGSGAPRVGHVIVKAFAARGYRTLLHANRSLSLAQETVQTLQQQGCSAAAFAADLRSPEEIQRFVEQAYAQFGRIDILINAAAIWEPQPLANVTVEQVRRHWEINTLATFLLCQQVGLKMVAQSHGGVIINIGDWAVVRPYLNYAAYFASKGALPTMTRDFAVELSQLNPRVRVNAILPGPVMLPPDLPQVEREQAIAGTLLKREGSPEHVADAALFLAENDFITGVCLPVDGGRTLA